MRECPGCNSKSSKFVGSKNGFDIHECRRCCSLFTSELPAAADVLNYDEYYSESNLSVPEFVIKRVNEILEGFSKYRKTNRMLDIGFGAGTILEVATCQGWEVFGQEVSKPAVDQALSKGFNVFLGTLNEAQYPTDSFDLVTCSEILEHVPDPQELVNEVFRILRPGGLFWATTPSARGISYRIMKTDWTTISPPEHTQLYSPKGIARMLRNAGFSRKTIKVFGTNPSEIRNHFRSKRGQRRNEPTPFSRVETSYALNEKLSGSPVRRSIKGVLNNTLNLLGLGDSVKIFAVK
jgi:2-polyprenyl-3-methyl-5-hydroxy-6-metoxy-1,4-benzoquinol methylase